MLYRFLEDLISDVRNRSDLGDSQFRTDDQITRYLNECNRQLTARLILLYGQDWLHKTDTITTANGTVYYPLPEDCFIVKFFRVTIDGYRIDIPRANNDELDVETTSVGWSAGTSFAQNVRHRIQGPVVRFIPTPTGVYTVTVHYVPTAIAWRTSEGEDPDYLNDTEIDDMSDDDTDYIASRWGFEEWVILKAAIKIKRDQEEDTTSLDMEIAELWADIQAIASHRVTGAPEKIRSSYDIP